MNTLNPKVAQIIQATVTVATIDQIVERTGLQRNSILALINTIKKEGFGTYDKETKSLTLTPEGIATLTPIEEDVEEDVVDVETMEELSPEMVVELTATPQLTDIVETKIVKPSVTAASKLANGASTTGKKGRAPDGSSKRAQFEAFMTANPGMRRKEYLVVAVKQFGLTEQGAGTYVYNFNKAQKAAGKPLISQQNSTPVVKVNVPTSYVQPTVNVVVNTPVMNVETLPVQ